MMSGPDSTERMFAMPAFEGLRILTSYRQKHPDLPNPVSYTHLTLPTKA